MEELEEKQKENKKLCSIILSLGHFLKEGVGLSRDTSMLRKGSENPKLPRKFPSPKILYYLKCQKRIIHKMTCRHKKTTNC